MFENLTEHLDMLKDSNYGEWEPKEQKGDGSLENPFQMPFVVYDRAVNSLIEAVYQFEREQPSFNLCRYHTILEEHGIEWGSDSMEKFDVSKVDGKCVMGLLMAAVRAERFCDGALLDFCKKGCVQKWLERLKELDEN